MNREIKFRAFDQSKKEMLLWEDMLQFRMEDLNLLSSVMQSTGLRDKNKNEIYEGDYIKINGVHIMEIKWCNGAFKVMECKSMVEMNFGDTWLHELAGWCKCGNIDYVINSCEVIGNIYYNKELLKT